MARNGSAILRRIDRRAVRARLAAASVDQVGQGRVVVQSLLLHHAVAPAVVGQQHAAPELPVDALRPLVAGRRVVQRVHEQDRRRTGHVGAVLRVADRARPARAQRQDAPREVRPQGRRRRRSACATTTATPAPTRTARGGRRRTSRSGAARSPLPAGWLPVAARRGPQGTRPPAASPGRRRSRSWSWRAAAGPSAARVVGEGQLPTQGSVVQVVIHLTDILSVQRARRRTPRTTSRTR